MFANGSSCGLYSLASLTDSSQSILPHCLACTCRYLKGMRRSISDVQNSLFLSVCPLNHWLLEFRLSPAGRTLSAACFPNHPRADPLMSCTRRRKLHVPERSAWHFLITSSGTVTPHKATSPPSHQAPQHSKLLETTQAQELQRKDASIPAHG